MENDEEHFEVVLSADYPARELIIVYHYSIDSEIKSSEYRIGSFSNEDDWYGELDFGVKSLGFCENKECKQDFGTIYTSSYDKEAVYCDVCWFTCAQCGNENTDITYRDDERGKFEFLCENCEERYRRDEEEQREYYMAETYGNDWENNLLDDANPKW